MNLLGELKRRNVFRVAAAYVVLSWLMLQAGDILFEALELPGWTMKFVVGLLAIGFIPVVLFSWVYELTPEGVKKESEVDRSQSITHNTGRKLDYVTIAMIVLGVAFVVAERWLVPARPEATTPVETQPVATTSSPAEPATSEAAEAVRSIAVLPFADMSPEGDQGYFSDGIAEEILNVLVRIDDLKVASRTSSFAYRGREQNIADIAGELGVQHILEGSVRKAGERVRITAQLIDAKDDRHLWSESFDRDLTDIFAIQDEIASAVVDALVGAFGKGQDGGRLIEASTENLNAYDLFLQAREMFLKRERIGEAIVIIQRALELDPNFARAWEVFAALLSVAPSWGETELGDSSAYKKRSDEAAEKALALDSDLYLATAILAQNLADAPSTDYDRVFQLMDRAIQINPRDPTLHLWRGISFRQLGFAERAHENLARCLEVDPAYENCRNNRTFVYLDQGNVDAAFQWLDRSLTELSIRHDVPYPYLVPDAVRQGEIRVAYLLAGVPSGRFEGDSRPIHWWIQGLMAPAQDHADSIARLQRWSEATGRTVHPLVWGGLGAYDRIEGTFELRNMMWRHDMTEFRKSPRFKAFIRESGTYDYWVAQGFPPRCRDLGDGDFECD